MSTPVSIRFDPAILERLRRRARAIPGATPSALAERLVDEGLEMAERPKMRSCTDRSGFADQTFSTVTRVPK
ncbi:MAG: hypothetical protein M0Z82_08925 [Actinomycetota bacterium]|nr:hypothetical protein [Actinomycetota bacterium]